jgi:hypothetical protein
LLLAARPRRESPRDLTASRAQLNEIKSAFAAFTCINPSPNRYPCTSSVRSGLQQHKGETAMAKGEQRSNRETKKPKKEKIKTIAAAPSQKGVGSLQPAVGSSKRK